MMKLGEWQKLQVVRVLPIGAYLADPQEMAAAGGDGKGEEVLLPANQLTDPVVPGEQIDVFLYRDSEDRLIATRQEPAITLGGIARLTVRETGKIGAFLDWGLVKDLLLPFAEQKRRVQPGDRVMVMLYIDNSDRLAATMRIEEHLTTDSPYRAGDMVTGTIYQIHPVIGAFTAVENRYHGLIPKKEFAGAVEAVASTGGQFTPPIMGAVGFVMAEFLNLSYTYVALAAVTPALLYYVGLLLAVHFEAKRLGLSGIAKENIPDAMKVIREQGHLVLPLISLIGLMFAGFTPLYAAVISIFGRIPA